MVKVKAGPHIRAGRGKGRQFVPADKEQKIAPPRVKTNESDLIRSIVRESFYEFVREFWDTVVQDPPVWNWHIRFLCNEAQKLVERVFKNLPKEYDEVVNVSPGSTKSLIFSVFLPIWCWTRMPHCRFLGISYAFTLAQELSKKSRDIVLSDKFKRVFPEIKLREDQNAKFYFQNNHGGARYAAGVDGTVTGFHFHIIVIDDPLNPKQASSVVNLKQANEFLKATLATRKTDKRVTCTILVMQRLHQDDPTAQFLQKKRIRHVCLPAELTQDVKPVFLRKYYRKRLMDPRRMDKESLDEAKENGQYYYASQYLQNPIPMEGGMFKVSRIKKGIPPAKFKLKIRFWDKAGTQDGGAFTVGVLMGIDTDNRIWILDVIRVQKDSWERETLIHETAYKDGYGTLVGIEEEPGSGGKESAETTVRRLVGFRVRVRKVNKSTGDKVKRADPFSVQVNSGNVYLDRKGKDLWHADWLEELKYFPHSKYKDQVDATANGFSYLAKKKRRIGAIA